VAWPSAIPHLVAAAQAPGVHHHLRHESFDFIGLALAAAASWFGIPGPGEPVLIAAGVLAAHHRLALVPVLVVAWAAATAGGIAGWLVGLKAGRRLLTWRGPLHAMRLRAMARGETMFASHPVIGILLAPSWIAGINRVRWTIFHPVNAASAVVWAGGVGVGGYLVGPAVIDVVDDVGSATAIILVVIVAGAVAVEIRRRRARRGPGRSG
jgi:membrane protein DedA with SNARE-associated domain